MPHKLILVCRYRLVQTVAFGAGVAEIQYHEATLDELSKKHCRRRAPTCVTHALDLRRPFREVVEKKALNFGPETFRACERLGSAQTCSMLSYGNEVLARLICISPAQSAQRRNRSRFGETVFVTQTTGFAFRHRLQ